MPENQGSPGFIPAAKLFGRQVDPAAFFHASHHNPGTPTASSDRASAIVFIN
jgi:hypothetical protein